MYIVLIALYSKGFDCVKINTGCVFFFPCESFTDCIGLKVLWQKKEVTVKLFYFMLNVCFHSAIKMFKSKMVSLMPFSLFEKFTQ